MAAQILVLTDLSLPHASKVRDQPEVQGCTQNQGSPSLALWLPQTVHPAPPTRRRWAFYWNVSCSTLSMPQLCWLEDKAAQIEIPLWHSLSLCFDSFKICCFLFNYQSFQMAVFCVLCVYVFYMFFVSSISAGGLVRQELLNQKEDLITFLYIISKVVDWGSTHILCMCTSTKYLK